MRPVAFDAPRAGLQAVSKITNRSSFFMSHFLSALKGRTLSGAGTFHAVVKTQSKNCDIAKKKPKQNDYNGPENVANFTRDNPSHPRNSFAAFRTRAFCSSKNAVSALPNLRSVFMR